MSLKSHSSVMSLSSQGKLIKILIEKAFVNSVIPSARDEIEHFTPWL
jgi:hypothetical protein